MRSRRGFLALALVFGASAFAVSPTHAAGSQTVSGDVTYADDSPAVNTIVFATDGQPVVAAHTDASGHYSLTLPAGVHTVRASTAGCTNTADQSVDLSDSDEDADFSLTPRADDFGYACTTIPFAFTDATHKMPLPKRKFISQHKDRLPFAFPFAGLAIRRVVTTTSGIFGLLPPKWSSRHTVNQGLIDVTNVVQRLSNADSAVLTSTVGSAPNRMFVVEWRDLDALPSGTHLTYELKLHENGDIDFLYKTIPPGVIDVPRLITQFTNQPGAPFFGMTLNTGQNPPLDGVAIHLAAP